MCAHLLRIEKAGPGLRARRLVFDDDDAPRTTSSAALKVLELEEGTEVDRGVLEEALTEIELPLAKDAAIRLLGYRERSTHELVSRLRDAGYPASVARAVATRFAEIELVDDARFARAWAASRAAAGRGKRRIAQELASKGIPDEIAEQALGEVFAGDDEVARARSALRGAVPKTRADRDRLLRRLIGRGFDFQTALRAVNEASQTQGETVDDPPFVGE